MTTGEKIAMLRKGNNITQEHLAELLGVTRQSVSRWEMDLAFPETEKLIRLSRLSSCSIDYLLNEVISKDLQDNVTISADTCVAFIRECGFFFLATSAEGQPRLRPLGMICTDGRKLFLATDSRKSVCMDLDNNRKVELASFHPVSRKWIRISGTAERDSQPVSRELVLSVYPTLLQKYPEGQEMFLAIYGIHIRKAEIL